MCQTRNSGKMKARAKIKSKYRTEIDARGHRILADEPLENGGQNSGPSPGDLLRSSLASCTAITLKMYADRKEWETGEISVDVEYRKNLDDFEPNFHVELSFENENLSEDQLNRLEIIANKCPVHKILSKSHEIQVKTIKS